MIKSERRSLRSRSNSRPCSDFLLKRSASSPIVRRTIMISLGVCSREHFATSSGFHPPLAFPRAYILTAAIYLISDVHTFHARSSSISESFIANKSLPFQVTRKPYARRSTGRTGGKSRWSSRVRIRIVEVPSRGRGTWWVIFVTSAASSPGSSVRTATTRARLKPTCESTLGPSIRTTMSTSSTFTNNGRSSSEWSSGDRRDTECFTERFARKMRSVLNMLVLFNLEKCIVALEDRIDCLV